MTGKRTLIATAGAIVLVASGYAVGASGKTATPLTLAPVSATVAGTGTSTWASMDAMHSSPWMQRMHDSLPAQLRAQCDAMHAQMDGMMGQWGGTGGMMPSGGTGGMMSGTTSGTSAMDHAAHHSTLAPGE